MKTLTGVGGVEDVGVCAVPDAALSPEPPEIGVDTEQELLEGWKEFR